jgi:membrane protease YdiL (CAAX protease family)
MKIIQSFSQRKLIFLMALPIILNSFASWIMVPFLNQKTSLPIEVCYFLSLGILVFIPMIFIALTFTIREKSIDQSIWQSMRINKLSGADWKAIILVLIIISVLSDYILPLLNLSKTPFFFQKMPFSDNNKWIILVWISYFFLNILGEEWYWRGYILPRQELIMHKNSWFFQFVIWAIWHMPLGLNVVISSLPILFLLPYIVQINSQSSVLE